MLNKFFDLMNVRSLTEAIQERNPNKEPYKSPNDSRLQVTVNGLLFTDHVDTCIISILVGLQRTFFHTLMSGKSLLNHCLPICIRMCPSQETMEGLRITGLCCLWDVVQKDPSN